MFRWRKMITSTTTIRLFLSCRVDIAMWLVIVIFEVTFWRDQSAFFRVIRMSNGFKGCFSSHFILACLFDDLHQKPIRPRMRVQLITFPHTFLYVSLLVFTTFASHLFLRVSHLFYYFLLRLSLYAISNILILRRYQAGRPYLHRYGV